MALKIIQIALAEVGYLEKASNSQLDSKTANAGKNNYNKYARDIWSSLQAQPWCDIFVSWCAIQAGESAAVGKYAYVPSHVQFFKNKGQYFARGAKTPQAGDIIFFQNESHVGLVEYVSGGYVHTIEGNTSGGSTLVANGGGVFQKAYSLTSSYIQGYGRPSYSSGNATSTTTTTKTTTKEDFEVAKTYKNGRTDEPVYADTKLTIKTGSLNPYEECDCLAIVDGRYLVRYLVDGTNYHKTGFVEYSGGVK